MTYLHLTLADSKGHDQGHAYFDSEYLANNVFFVSVFLVNAADHTERSIEVCHGSVFFGLTTILCFCYIGIKNV